MYTFPKKYPKHTVTMMHYEESDKKFFVKQAAREDSDSNGSKDEDPSQVYQDIKPDDNTEMHCMKQAHNTKWSSNA